MTEDEKKEAFYAGWHMSEWHQNASGPALDVAYASWRDAEARKVEVDALALMLDGTTLWSNRNRFGRTNVTVLEESPTSAAMTYVLKEESGIAEVAEAILELEAWADWYASRPLNPWPPIYLGEFALLAYADTPGSGEVYRCLEAAARLRDGWRPKGWEARGE